MKQFNLEEYLRLKEEGKEPKVVTRDEREVRIICTDKDGESPIVSLISENGIDTVITNHADGKFFSTGKHFCDLFFADPEPKYRPYKNAQEFIEAQKEHGPYIKACGQYFKPTLVDDSCIVTASISGMNASTYERVFELYSWQDGSCCGVKKDDGRTLELVDGRRMEV